MNKQKSRIERNQAETQSEKFMAEIGAAMDRHAKEEENKLDLAVLESWVAAAEEKKRLRRKKKYFAAAACFLLLCIGTVGIGSLLTPEDFEVTAGKNDPQVSEKGENTVIKDNQEDVEKNIGIEEVMVTKWKELENTKKEYPNLLIPEYIPEGYLFKSLSIEKSPLGERYTYQFKDGERSFKLVQENNKDLKVVKQYDRKIKNKDKTVIYIMDDLQKSGCCYIYNCLYTINGDFSDDEYVRIIDKLKR